MVEEVGDDFGGLAAAIGQFETSKQDAVDLARGLSDGQINWRPGPGRWSMGECLMHLAVSTDAALPAIAHGQQRAWPAARPYVRRQGSVRGGGGWLDPDGDSLHHQVQPSPRGMRLEARPDTARGTR